MKKSKIKLLTATACLALVGTASAAWVYAGTATASANIGVKVASYADAGTITINNADNLYVYLDNGSISYKKTDDTKVFSATYAKPTGFTDKELELTYKVLINPTLSTYINFDSSISGTSVIGEGSSKYIASPAYTWTSGDELLSSLPKLVWESTSGSFSSEDDYKTFITNLNGTGVPSDWVNTDDVSVGNLVTIKFWAKVSA